ncbi:RNA-binding transcriptional accessory protein [Peptostreptococcus anaerobius]|uniref:RNA-binding transcriptional accessory protein n=1 Tax=Peptostreptococcus porci TaxID=2652282 RepID=A0A6N7XGC2_9FIRM|nr:Tex family protein [Peptostreptococcus porci]MST62434.1 RNA-binding transcriptional accessory protein [Peptostreptococcus porci]
MDINKILEKELNLKKFQIENAIKLIDEGNTIPFIARYRKEQTGEMSDVQLRDFYDRLTYLRNLVERKDDIKRLIDEQGKLTDEIVTAVNNAKTLQEVEDIYAPYKQKKRTRATIAKERGLESLAMMILLSRNVDLSKEAENYIDEDKGVDSTDIAIDGAKDIIAEQISDDAEVRKYIRENALNHGLVVSKSKDENDTVYKMYSDFTEAVKTILPHRTLAINRGEKEGILSVKIVVEDEKMIEYIAKKYSGKQNEGNENILLEIAQDSYKRLIFPSIEREVRNHLTDIAQERAIKVFGQNLNGLLLQPPIKEKVVMGFDPAYRTGCKIAIVDKNGKLLDFTTVYPTEPQNKIDESKKILKKLIEKHKVDIISIGNGTASRESEKFVAEMISEIDRNVSYVIVNEAGASVYSASKLANEEHPDINVSIRGAISIARRLQDPMAELVKIEPKSIGVGQYQHDVNEKRLTEVLDGVVEDSVNKIGVDINTASFSLLEHIAGISSGVAKNIVAYRDENGDFGGIDELKKVKRLGPAAFKQSAGFIRIPNASNPLDNTGVHPESYEACEKIIDLLNYTMDDVRDGKLDDIDSRVKKYGFVKLCEDSDVGNATMKDIIEEIKKPGRDIRDSGIKPILRTDVMKLEDLEIDMELSGTVRNVVDFGAFVDIGIKNDGLVHISEISKKRINKVSDVLTVGDIVNVRVIKIDLERGKVGLSMKNVKQPKADV